ncbi:MAG: HAMP domain-containing histidine kinase [Candidatus Nealsonbacteria bacterium]|nr:HAMP domain-containing histidine kinase [Candidatus Nealsonbacteria bacterium]
MSGKIKEKVENIYQSNERLINLVNDLLNVSRIEAGAIKLKLEKTSLEETIKEVIEEIKIEAEKKNLYLRYQEPEKPLPNLLLDKEKIKEVILNLIDNAIKYTQKGGITITAEVQTPKPKKREEILIKIKDTGVGLTKEEIEKLFESFSRSKAGTTFHIEGAGLGLYVARKFVEMHQGKVWVESQGKDKGSAFYIELPIK